MSLYDTARQAISNADYESVRYDGTKAALRTMSIRLQSISRRNAVLQKIGARLLNIGFGRVKKYGSGGE